MSLNSLASAFDAKSVTPSDAADLPNGICRALFVGTGGDVSVVVADQTVLFKNLPNAYVLQVKVERVRATETTAQHLVALY